MRKISARLHFRNWDVTLWPSLQIQRPGLVARQAKGATAPLYRLQALFLRPHFRFMAAVRGRPSGLLGSFCPGRPTRVQLPPQFAWSRTVAAPQQKELRQMHAFNPSKNRAAAHRAMALAALHANSSLATRLTRYNAHMAKARALEAAGGAQ